MLDSIKSGAKDMVGDVSPTQMLDPSGQFDTSGATTAALMGGAKGGLEDLTGVRPCPSGSGGGEASSGGANDPCGGNNDYFKNMAVDAAMSGLAPSLMEAGDVLGEGLDTGLTSIASTVGDATASASSGIGSAMGLDPDGKGQSLLDSAVGTGATAGLSGAGTTTATGAALSGAGDFFQEENSETFKGEGVDSLMDRVKDPVS